MTFGRAFGSRAEQILCPNKPTRASSACPCLSECVLGFSIGKGSIMFQSILVPLDGSGFGEQALPLALTIARRSGTTVEIMHVHQLLDAYYLELTPMSETLEDSLRKH